MSGTEYEMRQQETERDSLQRVISQMQGALLFASADSRPVLATVLRNAASRLGVIEKKIQELHVARETDSTEQSNAVALAQRESRLNKQEQQTFAGFLKEDYFIKSDFGRLEDFYEKSWDRLSEHGKDEMSKRIWGGIRHGQYTFGQLPPKVREREMERVYGAITKQPEQAAGVPTITEKDRGDFIRAYEGGKTDEAAKILERQSFKNGMFLNEESKVRQHVAVGRDREPEKAAIAASIGSSTEPVPQKSPRAAKSGDKDLSEFKLDGVKLTEVETQGTSADIPNARVNVPSSARSTPGG